MNKKVLNLVNVNINSNTITLEFLYKDKKIEACSKLYVKFFGGKERYYTIKKCESLVVYDDTQSNEEVAKILIHLPLQAYGSIQFYIHTTNHIYAVSISDNKDKEICCANNPYVIFFEGYKIHIESNQLTLCRRNIMDRIKYEIKKQIYGMKTYKKFFFLRVCKRKKNKYYLFNDRLSTGDDNAEELFRYINEKYPEMSRNAYYVLEKDSNSLDRVRKIGNVLIYGSLKHKLKYLNCRMVISSHASYYENCFNPFNKDEMEMYKDCITKKFVFLQHGIIMNDVRKYHNRCRITADMFITSTKREFSYMNSEGLMYEQGMVIGTGLPRFDRLTNKTKKVILISPTWRKYVLVSNKDDKKNLIKTSEYIMVL